MPSVLDTVVVAAPVDDACFDGLGLEVLGEGFAEEGGELVVGGEAKGDELFDRELVDVGARASAGRRAMQAEALFEADDTVLRGQGGAACNARHDEEDQGHNDPPKERIRCSGQWWMVA